ncbi:MAG TPA: FAD-dependent oxidoreductase [Thermoplasmata archaeon]|nr:FAD-dependent oxidoreductase [Thermoplasmata archaeon]
MRVLIVGNNVAGTSFAKAVRDVDQQVDVLMFTDESRPYYARPKLIDYVAGEIDGDGMMFYPAEWYEKNGIALVLDSKVEEIDRKSKKILVNDEWIGYDKLVLANGSGAFVPPFKGLPKEGVFSLRTLDDADAIRDYAADAKNVVVIGGGLLGLEAARAVAKGFPGVNITVLEYAEHLLMRQLDHDGAAIIQSWIEGLGTKVLTNAETEEITGDSSVTGVRLKDGRTVDCDMVIVSAGARPNLALAKGAGLDVNRGVIVDPSLKTSDPDIHAIGDVAEFNGRVWGMIPPALDQARIAAKKVIGIEGPDYAGTIPSNTLKVMGIDLTSIGTVRSEHETPDAGFEEIRAVSPDGRIYKKFVLKNDVMIGAIFLGTKKGVSKVAKMIKDGQPVGAVKEKLADPMSEI